MKSIVFLLLLFVATIALTTFWMSMVPGEPHVGALPSLSEEEIGMQGRLEDVCTKLARDIGPRGGHRGAAPEQSEEYLQAQLRRTGLSVEEHTQESNGVLVRSFTAQVEGSTNAGEIVLVAAHMDTANQSPGADGDASGCAVVLEIAHQLRGIGFDRTVRFALFGHGAAPYAGTSEAGSYHYARVAREHHEKFVAVLVLDGLGVFKDDPGTQAVPFPFSFFYPDTGNFVAFVGDFDSRDVMQKTVELFRANASFPAYGASVPAFLPGATDSDNYGFWQMGFPAVLVTDTCSLRNTNYDKMSDTSERLDYARMARVASGLAKTVSALASRTTSLY